MAKNVARASCASACKEKCGGVEVWMEEKGMEGKRVPRDETAWGWAPAYGVGNEAPAYGVGNKRMPMVWEIKRVGFGNRGSLYANACEYVHRLGAAGIDEVESKKGFRSCRDR
eukprot:363858-Chlamydomonas_euryale.AAC.3